MAATMLTRQSPLITVDQLISPLELRPAYQPIVDIQRGHVVGYEALARWPNLDVPVEKAFAMAAEEGRVAELDRACVNQALLGAVEAGLDESQVLFVNMEPDTAILEPDAYAKEVAALAVRHFPVVTEITERAIVRSPAQLLRALARIRRSGGHIALDDVGAAAGSMALLPFAAPDIIKLDLHMTQGKPDRRRIEVVYALLAYAERTGVTLLAEGIETRAHLDQAICNGATLGQGWYFGYPGPLVPSPHHSRRISFVDQIQAEPLPPGKTPFDLIDETSTQIASKRFLVTLSRSLEDRSLVASLPPVILAAVQDVSHFGPATRRRYEKLARRSSLVAVFGQGLDRVDGPNLRSNTITHGDSLKDEWTVVVVTAHFAVALIARDLGDTGPDLDRRFAYRLTHDRALVLAVGRTLLNRLAPP